MIGFEYWADPSAPTDGFITWQVDGKPSVRVGAAAVGPDTDPTTGSGVGQRLIPEEPMVSAFYVRTLLVLTRSAFSLLFLIWVYHVCLSHLLC